MEKGNSKIALIVGLIVIVVIIVAVIVVFREDNKNEINKNNINNSSNIEQNSGIPEPDSMEPIEPDAGTQLVEPGI